MGRLTTTVRRTVAVFEASELWISSSGCISKFLCVRRWWLRFEWLFLVKINLVNHVRGFGCREF